MNQQLPGTLITAPDAGGYCLVFVTGAVVRARLHPPRFRAPLPAPEVGDTVRVTRGQDGPAGVWLGDRGTPTYTGD